MQAEEKHHDRRRDKRRDVRNTNPESEILTDQDKRHGDRRCNPRRRTERINLSFEISLPDQDGKTINVSASGVCFEVALKRMEDFAPGTTIPLQINTVTNKPGFLESKLKLSGTGTVIRSWIIEKPDHENSLFVALKFTERLNVVLNND